MTKSFRAIIAVLFVAGVSTAVWFLMVHYNEPEEPSYGGMPLSQWLEGYSHTGHGFTEEEKAFAKSDEAMDIVVRQMGTNALPTLFRMLTAVDSPWRKLEYCLARYHIYHSAHFSTLAMEKNYCGARGFRALGADASNAVPRLTYC